MRKHVLQTMFKTIVKTMFQTTFQTIFQSMVQTMFKAILEHFQTTYDILGCSPCSNQPSGSPTQDQTFRRLTGHCSRCVILNQRWTSCLGIHSKKQKTHCVQQLNKCNIYIIMYIYIYVAFGLWSAVCNLEADHSMVINSIHRYLRRFGIRKSPSPAIKKTLIHNWAQRDLNFWPRSIET